MLKNTARWNLKYFDLLKYVVSLVLALTAAVNLSMDGIPALWEGWTRRFLMELIFL